METGKLRLIAERFVKAKTGQENENLVPTVDDLIRKEIVESKDPMSTATEILKQVINIVDEQKTARGFNIIGTQVVLDITRIISLAIAKTIDIDPKGKTQKSKTFDPEMDGMVEDFNPRAKFG